MIFHAHFIKSSDKSAAIIIDKVFNSEPQQESVSEVIQPVIEGKKDLPIEHSGDSDTVADFKFIKAEMQRLGFDSYDEYLNFIARKKQQRK